MAASITSIEKALHNLGKKLEAEGFEIDLKISRSGNGRCYLTGTNSYGEITLRKGDEYECVRWNAYGYCGNSDTEFTGKISEMKAKTLAVAEAVRKAFDEGEAE